MAINKDDIFAYLTVLGYRFNRGDIVGCLFRLTDQLNNDEHRLIYDKIIEREKINCDLESNPEQLKKLTQECGELLFSLLSLDDFTINNKMYEVTGHYKNDRVVSGFGSAQNEHEAKLLYQRTWPDNQIVECRILNPTPSTYAQPWKT